MQKKDSVSKDKIKTRKLNLQKKEELNISHDITNTKRKKKDQYFFSHILTKQNLVYSFLILVDIILIIYFAKQNVVNYVELAGKEIFLGETKDLLWGRNYITLIVTVFFSIYTMVIQKFFFKRDFTKKYVIVMFLFYFILNLVLFYLFTERVY